MIRDILPTYLNSAGKPLRMQFDLARQGQDKENTQDRLGCIHEERFVDPDSDIHRIREKNIQEDQSNSRTDQKENIVECLLRSDLSGFIAQEKKEPAQQHQVQAERQTIEFILFSEKLKLKMDKTACRNESEIASVARSSPHVIQRFCSLLTTLIKIKA